MPNKKHNGRQPRFIAVDFFCGAGGTTRGLLDAGGYVIAGIDKDADCRDTYLANNKNRTLDRNKPTFLLADIFPKTKRHPAGQQEELLESLEALIQSYRKEAPDVPLLFAICAPCQPFTSVSKSEMSDKRLAIRRRDKNLLSEAMKFVDRFKPDLVLSENVQGISDKRYGGVWESFRKNLHKAGYATGTKVVCASRFGIPQYRKRSILVAAAGQLVRPEAYADARKRELLVPDRDPRSPLRTVQEAIGHLPPLKAGEQHARIPNHRTRNLSELNYTRLSLAKPGTSNAYLEDTPYGDLSLKCHKKVNKKFNDRCFGDVYTRMDPKSPSPTITTKCHSVTNGRYGHYDVSQVRAISLREAAILQSFPERYVFFPKDQLESVARMIGNAVPPRLARYFSRYLSGLIRQK